MVTVSLFAQFGFFFNFEMADGAVGLFTFTIWAAISIDRLVKYPNDSILD